MKKIVILNLIIFNVLFINAQTHRFFYKVSFKKDSLSEKYITEKRGIRYWAELCEILSYGFFNK